MGLARKNLERSALKDEAAADDLERIQKLEALFSGTRRGVRLARLAEEKLTSQPTLKESDIRFLLDLIIEQAST